MTGAYGCGVYRDPSACGDAFTSAADLYAIGVPLPLSEESLYRRVKTGFAARGQGTGGPPSQTVEVAEAPHGGSVTVPTIAGTGGAARITTNNPGNAVSSLPVEELSEGIGMAYSTSRLVERSYKQIQEGSYDVALSYVKPKRLSDGVLVDDNVITGRTDTFKEEIDLYVSNMSSGIEAVSTLVHESSHVRSLTLGRPTNTQYDEFMAFRREHLFLYGEKPTLDERRRIWRAVTRDYEHLPPGNVPAALRKWW
ncbi:hypothetical protein [Myxococcus sp. CA040A]|uniref:hypothetical protein n=1 Tax=Myxococcus sp. CA040A TaxID=2741738 RepID=UPI00157B479C|nr:hypothetical protein [Myxococcus sp. CA040A]NTX06599.1 hypothetical protein [Myxococcus sp. CA040A]